MRIFKKILPCAAGICLFLAINTLLCFLIIPYQFTRVKVHHIEEDEIQDLILGSSHGASALDPSALTAETGRSCYNGAAGGQYACDNYYLLKDARRNHNTERVIYEYDPSYWLRHDSMNANARYLQSVMEWSPVSLAYFRDLCLGADLRYALMPWFLYDIKTQEMSGRVELKLSDSYRTYGTALFTDSVQAFEEDGMIALADSSNGSREIPVLSYGPETEKTEREQWKQFERLLEYCERNGIDLVVVTTPVPESTYLANESFYRESHDKMSKLADQHHFSFLDYASSSLAEGCEGRDFLWEESSFSDAEGHMRVTPAKAFSALFAKHLTGLSVS